MVRPAAAYLHTEDAGVVVVPARVCAFLFTYAAIEDFQRRYLGRDRELDTVLIAMGEGARRWHASATGNVRSSAPEPAASSEWLSSTQAATQLHMTDRGVRIACATGRLPATRVDGRWRISRDDMRHFRAARDQR